MLNLKDEMAIAYEKGRIKEIIDFAINILRSSKRSKVFKETNPWIGPIFSLLKEIQEKKDIKKQIQLKIRILFEKDL